MTLLDALGYAPRAPSRTQRKVQRAASTALAASVLSRILNPLDRFALRVSGGRWSLTTAASGVDILVLATRGRSGRARLAPLMVVPLDGALALVGSNFGQDAEPAWTRDLRRGAEATVAYHGRSVAVVARPATPEERERALATASAIYPGIAAYAGRPRRPLHVFVLAPRSLGSSGPAPPRS